MEWSIGKQYFRRPYCLIAGGAWAHFSFDLHRNISDEVAVQLKPMQADLRKLDSSLSELRGFVHGQASKVATMELRQFAALDPPQLRQEAGKLNAVIESNQKNSVSADLQVIANLQAKLLKTNAPDHPGISGAAEALINYSSFIRDKSGFFPNARLARARTCQLPFNNSVDVVYSHTIADGCTLKLDGKTLYGSYFKNRIIVYEGGSATIDNTVFENCLFELKVAPSEQKSQVYSQIAKTLLAATGEHPKVTMNAAS